LHFHDLLMTPLQKPFSPRHCTALRALQCRWDRKECEEML
jgi:hypothetical protein